MPKRSKLLQALDEHKGRDYEAEKQKKLVKAAEKKKKAKKAEAGEDEDEKMVEEEKVCAIDGTPLLWFCAIANKFSRLSSRTTKLPSLSPRSRNPRQTTMKM